MTSEEFDELIDKYMSGNASPAEERLIDEFFRSQQKKSSLHYQGGLPSDAMWDSIENRIGITPSVVRKRRNAQRNLVLVCLTILMASLGVWYSFDQNPAIAKSEISLLTSTTGRGQKSIVTLSDGSRVYLNSGSFISYPEVFSPDKREITLSGEAFFEVTRDEKRPFIIQSGDVTTKVLGTSFNIRAFEQTDISVTVATGKVQVETSAKIGGPDTRVLTPNQQAVYNDHGFVTSDVNIERFIAWKSNTIHFEDTPLEQAVPVLERWFNVKIEFESDAIKNCRINGKYKDQTLNAIMKSIQYMYPIEYKRIDDNKLILYGKGCNQ
jgi:transmembrane sensor